MQRQPADDGSTLVEEQRPTLEPAPVQRKCAACAAEEEEEAEGGGLVQGKCAACAEEERAEEGESESVSIQSRDVGLDSSAPASGPGGVHQTARGGLKGANQGLPHGERIRSAFGRHDLSEVRTRVGGEATVANRSLGSLAYTSGAGIAFRGPPSLHLAAHEAAHVVQQRQGVQLKNGVGRPGDRYEQQADAVADRVVAGGSAENLLDETPGGRDDAGGAFQAKCSCGGTCASCAAGGTEEEEEPIQMQLMVSATRLFEESAAGGGGPAAEEEGAEEEASAEEEGGAEDEAAEGTAEEEEGTEGEAETERADEGGGGEEEEADGASSGTESAEGGGGGAAAAGAETTAAGEASPGGAGGGSPAAPGPAPSASGEAGGGSSAPAASCTPECYREPSEEPAEEPDEAPTNPPPGEIESEASEGDEEDLPEIDDCPTEEAEAAVGSAPETAELATTEAGPAGSSSGEAGPTAAGGGPPAGGPEAGASPLDGMIASAESGRELAIAAYATSSSSLASATATTKALRGGIELSESPGESADQRALRRAAADRVDRFFAGVADQLDEALAYASTDIPEQLGAAAESAKAEIGASMEAQKAAISASIDEARAQARANAASARAAVQAQAAAYIADVEAAASTAIESVTQAHADSIGQVDAVETSSLDGINEIYAQGRTDLEALGTTAGDECVATAESLATQYEGFRNCTEDGFWDGNLSERRANAQAEAARSLGQTYHERMVDAARKRAREVTRNGRKTDRCAIIAAANRSRDTLDEQLPDLVGALESTRDAAIEQAGVTEGNLTSSIDSSLASTLAQLDQQESTKRQAINDTGYLQQVLQEQVAHNAATAVQLGVQTAVDSVQQAMRDVQARFAAGIPPDSPLLENALSEVEGRVNAAMDGLHTSAFDGAMAAEGQLAEAAAQALTSLEAVTEENAESASSTSEGFAEAMGGIAGVDNFAIQRTTITEQLQQATQAASDSLAQVVDGFQESCDSTAAGAQEQLTEAASSLEENLRQSKQGLECEITSKATEAAAKEPPAWKKVVAVVLVIIVIIIVIAVTVITAGAAGPVIVAALGGPLLAGAIIGAVVGAVVSGLLAMASNLWNNRDVMEGVGQAVLVGFITGAAGGFIGAAAGAGAGALFASASPAIQTAAQFAAAMISAGGFDVVTQYVMGGFSFDNFSVENLATTLVITAVTFGLAHQVSARAAPGAPPTDAPDAVTTTDAPDAMPTADAPEAVPTTDTPEAVPTAEAPEPTPTTEAPEPVPTAEAPEPAPTTEAPEPTPTDALEPTPTDAPEATPTTETPEPGAPGSPEHKAARWAEYQERGGTWSYERWSNVYEANMVRARVANEAADAYHSELGWGRREVTVDVEGAPRRIDIADEAAMRGIEYKTGYQTANKSNRWEVLRDQMLVERGWDIKWVFEGRGPSRPLLDLLEGAGIGYEIR